MRIARATLTLLLSLFTLSAARAQDEPGYPIEEFLGVTVFPEVAVSPDGRHIALVTLSDDFESDRPQMAIWRIDLDEGGRVTGHLRLTSRPGAYSGVRWSPDSRYLAFLRAGPPGMTPQLFVLDMRGGEALMLSDEARHSEGVVAFDWSGSGSLIFAAPVPPGAEQRQAHEDFYGDVIRFHDQAPRTSFWQADARPAASEPRAIASVAAHIQELAVAPDGEQVAYVTGPPVKPEVFANSFAQSEVYLLALDGSGEPRPVTRNFVSEVSLTWNREGDGLLASGVGDPGANRTHWSQGRLYQIDLDGEVQVVVPGFIGELNAPFGQGAYAPLPDGTVLSAAQVSTRTNFYAVDPSSGSARQLTDFAGAVSVPSASRDGETIAFVLSTRDSFPEIYVAGGVDELRQPRRVTDFNTELSAMPAPEVEAIRWQNGEGDEIEGVLYWPPGRRAEPGLPLVVDIHGGPWWARNEELTFNAPFTFAYYPALLASRGYLVLEPNYRGGTGRGDEFLHAIEGYSCSRPATDILTGVDHLVAQGWADPERAAVMGYSYGGLMTNCLITKTDRFSAAASGAGLWNDISYFGTADNFIQNEVRNLGAAPWENLENYWEESPISGAGNITTPTLIVIGGADRRVPTTQGYELYRALVHLGVPTELLIFPDEGHGFRGPDHKLTKVRAEIRWIDRYLLDQEDATSDSP